jgi:hypothetical protein
MTDRSPFESSTIITMYLEPVLNEYYRTYQNIITLSGIPEGPLENMVAHIRTPSLSEFQTVSPWDANPFYNRCKYVLLRFPKTSIRSSIKNGKNYMFAEDVPNIYGYLDSHGYKIMDIDRHLFLRKHQDSNKPIVCMFRYT